MASLDDSSKVLVTGAAGFIGSHLVEALLSQGHDVVGIDRRDPRTESIARRYLMHLLDHPRLFLEVADLAGADLSRLLDGVGCVFHLAAIPGVRASWHSFDDYLAVNVSATQRLLSAGMAAGVPRLVYASSSSVYGEARGPSREGDITQPVSPYGVSKLAGEQLCLAHAKQTGSGLMVTALRYFTVYGPRQRPDMGISRLLAASLTGAQYTLFGDGTQRREFTYIDDVVRATIAAAAVEVPAAVVNVGGGSSSTLIETIRVVSDVTGNPVPLTAVPAQPGDVPATAADLTLARILLGYEPTVDLRTGIARHADWLRQLPEHELREYVPPPVKDQETLPC